MRAFAAVSKDRIPLFIQEDYPVLVDFLAAYYDWMQQGLVADADFLTISDIDQTKDEFLKYFKDNHAKGLPTEIEADTRAIIKHIRELYKSKGTDSAIKALFRAVFNESAEIFYPKTQILHSSDATWVRRRSITINPNGFSNSFFKDSEATIPFGRFYIVSATTLLDGNVRLEISDIKGNLDNETTFTLKNEMFSIIPQVVGVNVITPGSGFVVGEYINLNNNVVVQVREVTRGPITAISVVSGGTGYNGEEPVQLFDAGPLGSAGGIGASAVITQVAGIVTDVTVTNPGSYYSAPPEVFCDSSSGTDAVFEASGNFSGIKSLYVVDSGYSLPGSPWSQTIGTTTLQVVFGNVTEHQGYFANQNGMLSSKTAYLEDEHYYQYYSYVIKSGVNTAQYEKVLRLFAHPAGMKFFGAFLIEELVPSGNLAVVSEFIVDIETLNSGEGSLTFSAYELNLNTQTDSGVRRHQVDRNKFIWFYESTFINRFKDFVIREWEDNKGNNPFYFESTNIQPDCIVQLLTIAPGGTEGYGLDAWGESQYG